MKASLAALVLFASAPSLWAQTATPRAGGGMNVSYPSGRTATVVPQGTQVMITVRERDGREWRTAEMLNTGDVAPIPKTGAPDPQNRFGNPARMAEAICKM